MIPGQFEPGHAPIPGAGRPLGSKDEKWKSAQALWDELQKLMPSLTASEKAKIIMQIFMLHADRVLAHLPNTPEESLKNAKEAFEKVMANSGMQILKTLSSDKENK